MDIISTNFPSWLISSTVLLYIFPCIFVYVLIWNKSSSSSNVSINLPPGPPKLPIIGNAHHVLSKNVHRKLWQLSQKYGPIMLINAGAKPSSDITMEILKTQHNIFATRPFNKGTKRISYNFSDVTFSPHGDHWREMRKVFVTEYLGSKRAGRFNQLLRMEIDGLNNILSSNPLNTQVNLNNMLLALVYGVVGKFAFGKSYREHPFNGVTLKEVIGETMTMFAGSAADVFPTYGLIVDKLSGWNGRLEKCFGYLDGYFQTIMDEHFQTLNEVSEDEKDYTHSLVQLSLEDPRFIKIHIKALLMDADMSYIFDPTTFWLMTPNILDVLLGTIDTTYGTMIWAMAEIVKNPRVMQKLQSEIRSCVGRKLHIEASDIANMAYLKMVMKEALRLHPPTPLSFPRHCAQDCKIGEYNVLAGTVVVMNAWGIARNPSVWKENPNVFYPERFENLDIDVLGNNFEMIPFGGGRRQCPGMKSASSTMELTLVNLLYWFDWEMGGGVRNEHMDMEEVGFLVSHKKSPLCLVPIKHNWED